MRLLTSALAAIVVLGWSAGFALTRLLGRETLAHLDLPARMFLAGHQRPGLLAAMQDVTLAGSDRVVLPVAIAVGLWWGLRRDTWRPLVMLVAAYVGGAFIALTDRVAVGRGRPTGTGLAAIAGAFPSGHATQAMAVYGTVGVLAITATPRRWVQLAVFTGAATVILGVAFSRLYPHVHWLTDVAAGLTLGALWVAALASVEFRGSHALSDPSLGGGDVRARGAGPSRGADRRCGWSRRRRAWSRCPPKPSTVRMAARRSIRTMGLVDTRSMVRFGGDALLSPLVFSVVGATLLWVLASRSGSVVNIKAFLQSQGAGKVPHLYFNALGAVALIGALVFAAVWAVGVVVLSAASDRVGGMRIDVIEVETARPITTSTSAP